MEYFLFFFSSNMYSLCWQKTKGEQQRFKWLLLINLWCEYPGLFTFDNEKNGDIRQKYSTYSNTKRQDTIDVITVTL